MDAVVYHGDTETVRIFYFPLLGIRKGSMVSHYDGRSERAEFTKDSHRALKLGGTQINKYALTLLWTNLIYVPDIYNCPYDNL